MSSYTVLVHYTDRSRLPCGRFRTFPSQVTVLADHDDEATLIAAQMVAAIRDDAIDGMVTSTRIIDMEV